VQNNGLYLTFTLIPNFQHQKIISFTTSNHFLS
ncbi:MAG: hypothetical protein ACI97N_002569, partial [Cognaticolwellia sp.]